MPSRRQIQVSEMVAHLAGEFFARESNQQSLITVTRADASPNFKDVVIFLSVLPEAREEPALEFAKRQRSAFRDYVRKHSKLHPLPTIDFELDWGEKNRQRVEKLL